MLAVGTPMPSVLLKDQHGADVRLGPPGADSGDPPPLMGPLVVVFYPAAFTGVCTRELRAVRDSGLAGQSGHRESVVAISCDSFLTLRAFADAEEIHFPLLSDFWPHGEASQRYDAFDAELGTSTRTTYIADPAGVIRWAGESGLRDERDITRVQDVFAELVS